MTTSPAPEAAPQKFKPELWFALDAGEETIVLVHFTILGPQRVQFIGTDIEYNFETGRSSDGCGAEPELIRPVSEVIEGMEKLVAACDHLETSDSGWVVSHEAEAARKALKSIQGFIDK